MFGLFGYVAARMRRVAMSLPGAAGESESTILEVLSRNTISNLETEETQKLSTTTDDLAVKDIVVEEEEQIDDDGDNKTTTLDVTVTTDNPKEYSLTNVCDSDLNICNNNEIKTVENEENSSARENQSSTTKQIETETSLVEIVIKAEPSNEIILDFPTNKNTESQINASVKAVNEDINKLVNLINDKANDSVELVSHIEKDIETIIQTDCTPDGIKADNENDKLNIVHQTEEEEVQSKNNTEEETQEQINSNLDFDIEFGRNGIENCKTPLEEEEKKKLLDSLPQLDEDNSTNPNKQFYQSLKEYLSKHQSDKPPVPLQTYRWEDLKRAKEKGGYPWTHLYKRPLGPDEEPEIVLLLRKSQEFRFHSESPRSLKKVRIHNQVLVQEADDYLPDSIDTDQTVVIHQNGNQENSFNQSPETSTISEPITKKSKIKKLKGILKRSHSTNSGRPNISPVVDVTQIEEDKQSLQSEPAISNVKKSKLNRFKGFVKRQSEHFRKSNQKEPTSIFYSVDDGEVKPVVETGDENISNIDPENKRLNFEKIKEILKGKLTLETSKQEVSSDKKDDIKKDDEELKPSRIDKIKNIIKEKLSKEAPIQEQNQLEEQPETSILFKETEFSSTKVQTIPDDSLTSAQHPEAKKSIFNQLKDKITGRGTTEPTSEDDSHLNDTSVSESISENKSSKLDKIKGIFKDLHISDKSKTSAEEPLSISSTDTIPNKSLNSTSPTDTEDNQSIQSETVTSKSVSPETSVEKKTKLKKLTGIAKRRPGASKIKSQNRNSIESEENYSPLVKKCCHPIMDKIKTLTDKQLAKRNIKKVPLKDDERIILEENQKILKLRESPKSDHNSEIPKFIEKQDSEDNIDIVELDESPSQKRKEIKSTTVIPDEIIDLPQISLKVQEPQKNEDFSVTPEPTVSEILEADQAISTEPPIKTMRKSKLHVYEDIEDNLALNINQILEIASVEALKKSLATQDETILKDMEKDKKIILDRMGSSEEDIDKPVIGLLMAPMSSIDSASSDEQEKHIAQLSPVAEESDVCSGDEKEMIEETIVPLRNGHHELNLGLTKESSPCPSTGEKKVTFSHVEDDAEPHREDIEVPEGLKGLPNRWSTMTDHEYEPIGEPQENNSSVAIENGGNDVANRSQQAKDFQKDLEDRYFSSAATTPTRSASNNQDSNEMDTSAFDDLSSPGSDSPKRGFMASAQDKSRKLRAGIRTHAGKVKTRLRSMKKQSPRSSPKRTERKKFKAPHFSQIRFPVIPTMPKFKKPEFKKPEFKKMEFKRPEFTKFNKPDMSRFKIPEKFSSLRLKRSRSMKEEGDTAATTTGDSEITPESGAAAVGQNKKKFEFNFGTYPRAFRRKKIKDSIEDVTRVNEVSTVPSSETPPSVKARTILRGTRAEGPVGSRWQDKFSDVSFGDSESGRFQRYGSELESFDRESSMERRMKDDLAAQEENELAVIGTVEQKQFAEYDEENRAIHEISKIREDEFKQRRPIIHQDSNISEESKDVGWTDREAMRNKILRRSEVTPDKMNISEDALTTGSVNTNQETQSTGSSGAKKGVLEEIDEDEFFLRKRGISQDNIEIRQYISSAIREGFDNPINSLTQIGSAQDDYLDSMMDSSQDPRDFGYDVPPPRKPRRTKRYNNFDRQTKSRERSQEYGGDEQKENYDDNISLPQTDNDFFKNYQPQRPLRKSKKSSYSEDSQSDFRNMRYFDDDIEKDSYHKDLNFDDFADLKSSEPPQAPKRRRKKQLRDDSIEKETFMNGFGGRSISNSYIDNDIQPEEMIVYRTEHAYVIPLAQPESLTTPSIRSSQYKTSIDVEDDTISQEIESINSDARQPVDHQIDEKFNIEMKENDGYAVVRKAPPPRPPPPERRKKHERKLQHFDTMPNPGTDILTPERPRRNYSTIGPCRPARRKISIGSADLQKSASDITQYEDVDSNHSNIENGDLQKNLQSGDIIRKMKHRPLPPPPAPPRGKKGHKEPKRKSGKDEHDHDDNAEKIISDFNQNGTFDVAINLDKCIEVEVSTQTDPLPDDFVCEEFEITDDMKIIEPRIVKTITDLEYEENLQRSLQRFIEENQRSFSEQSKSESPSRPHTPPVAIIGGKRVSTPIPNSRKETLTVQPVDDNFDSDEYFAGDYPLSETYKDDELDVAKEYDQSEYERDKLNEFIEHEIKQHEIEEARKKMEEIRLQEEKEEQEVLEKIRELQRLEEEEERKTLEQLKQLDLEEEERKRFQEEQQQAEEEHKKRMEADQKVLEQILELEKQEEENRRILEKIKQLEREFSDNKDSSPIPESDDKVEAVETSLPAGIIEQDVRTEETQKIPIVEIKREIYEDPEIERLELEDVQPPNPPPRKRSTTNLPTENRTAVSAAEQPVLEPVTENILNVNEHQESRTISDLPHCISDLEVERLRVHALQAGQILVSNLQGSQVRTDELECKSGNLVVKKLELPEGFIDEIVERVRSRSECEKQASDKPASEEQPPQRPPLPQPTYFPSEYMHSVPPAAFYQLRNPDEEQYQPNLQAPRRRRHHRTKRDSSSDDDSYRHRNRRLSSSELTVSQTGGQFLQACGHALIRSMNLIANYVRASQKEETGQRNLGRLVAFFLLMVLGYWLITISGRDIHHHHWDYLNPPDNNGRPQK